MAILAVTSCLAAGVAIGDTVPTPVLTFTNIPPLPSTSYYYGARFSSDGLLYLWDGTYVWRQDGVNVDGFTQIGEVVGNMADAGPIHFSRDGSLMLLGNGAGGLGPHLNPPQPQHGGRIFSMLVGGEVVDDPIGDIDYHYDFEMLSEQSTISGADDKFFVNYGWEYYMTDPKSWVSVFDAESGANQVVLTDIPGASGAVTIDNEGSLYACVGYGAERGLIKKFSVEAVDEAYDSEMPLTWSDGVAVNPDNYDNQSAAGLFFDSRGFLFSGGNEGLTVFRPDGTSGTFDVGSGMYSSVAYNPLTDQVVVMTEDSFTYDPVFIVYAAREFLPLILGDANWDNTVDEKDAQILAQNWGMHEDAYWVQGDFNGDGAVDVMDASILAANWGNVAPGSGEAASVPEPATMTLLLGTLFGLAGLRFWSR
jgi:hypothetical protein